MVVPGDEDTVPGISKGLLDGQVDCPVQRRLKLSGRVIVTLTAYGECIPAPFRRFMREDKVLGEAFVPGVEAIAASAPQHKRARAEPGTSFAVLTGGIPARSRPPGPGPRD